MALSLKRLLEEARYYESQAEKPQTLESQAIWRTLANNCRLQALCMQADLDQ